MKHAELSGSSAHRWIACPGSVALARTVERRGSSPAAREGTKAHGLAENVLRYWRETREPESGLRARWREGTSFKWTDHEEEMSGEVEQEMLDQVMVYVDRVVSIVAQHTMAAVYLEKHVTLKNLVRDGMFGTSDVIIDVGKTLYVIDFKYGYSPVHLIGEGGDLNSQLMYYAAGALDGFKWRHETVFLEIVQPRSQEVEDVQSHGVPARYVKEWAETTLFDAAHAVDEPDAPLVPGEHCRFCDALAICPAVHSETQSLAASDFAGVAPRVPNDPVGISKVLKFAPVIDAWLRECEAHAQALLERGTEVPGFKLVRKKTNRKFDTDSPKELIGKLRKAGFRNAISPVDLMAEPKMKSPAQLEKLIGKEIVNKVAVKPEGDVTVAAESDAREAVGPVNDFEELL